ncbi:MAG: hydroxymethylglutaryl-CoA lyase [Elusimicrobia bacterium]|nr:hydroxymethylglutaryl-CoA lyase [Elusimicrobiota bacterium]
MIDATSLPRPRFVEVGPGDGLRHEPASAPLEAKVAFIDALSESGLREIAAGAFSGAPLGSQLADSAEVFENMKRKEGVVYSALALDEKGLDAALAAEADKIEFLCSASETYSQRSLGQPIAHRLELMRPIVGRARKAKLPLRACVSAAFHCPYEGAVRPEAVAVVVERLRAMGVGEFSLGDTIGRASPLDVRLLLESLLKRVDREQVFLHLHDTYGMAVAGALTAWSEYGVSGFDCSTGGIGGCFYAPGVGGNVATEDLAFAFMACGASVIVDMRRLKSAGDALALILGHPMPSHLSKMKYG